MDQFTTVDGGAAGGMTRSSSEGFFQNFLQEAPVAGGRDDDVVEITRPQAEETDPRETEALLKQQLIMCWTVGARGHGVQTQDSSNPLVISNSQSLDSSQLESQTVVKGGGLGGIPTAPVMQNSGVHGKPTTSVSPIDLSDDDELEGEMEMTENMDHVDTKRVRRMISNRESERCSRRRKQAHLIELEAQVSQLRVENSSLLKRLAEANQKYTESVLYNLILEANVETLRAKVKMAEDTLKGMTGMSPAAPPHKDIVHGVVSGVKRGRTASMQRVESPEHLQKRIYRGSVQWDATAGWGADISMN